MSENDLWVAVTLIMSNIWFATGPGLDHMALGFVWLAISVGVLYVDR